MRQTQGRNSGFVALLVRVDFESIFTRVRWVE